MWDFMNTFLSELVPQVLARVLSWPALAILSAVLLFFYKRIWSFAKRIWRYLKRWCTCERRIRKAIRQWEAKKKRKEEKSRLKAQKAHKYEASWLLREVGMRRWPERVREQESENEGEAYRILESAESSRYSCIGQPSHIRSIQRSCEIAFFLFEKDQNYQGSSRTRLCFADLAVLCNNYTLASSLYHAAARRSEHPRIDKFPTQIATIYMMRLRGELREAKNRLETLRPWIRENRDSIYNADLSYHLGVVMLLIGEIDDAGFEFKKALDLYKEKHKLSEANVLFRMGELEKSQGNEEQAKKNFSNASILYDELAMDKDKEDAFNQYKELQSPTSH